MSYVHALMKAHALGLIRPEVAHVEVAHDPSCPALKRRACRCCPDVLLLRGGEVLRNSLDGIIEREARKQ